MRKALKGFLAVTTVLTMAFVTTVGVAASSYSYNLTDDFNSIDGVNPFDGGNLWILNSGLDSTGNYNVVNDFCSVSTCVLPKSEDGVDFASLEMYDTIVDGVYYGAEMAELLTGYSYGQPTELNPEPGSPVVLEARVRFSDNYQADGSGGAIGSAGIWLWNSPIDYTNFQFYPQDGIGFNWVDDGSVFAPGMNMGVINDSLPAYQVPVRDIDMSEWNTFKVVWKADATGRQQVHLFLNNQSIGSQKLDVPLSDLSLEIWNDNQKPVDFAGTIDFSSPTETQAFQIDYISITKR